MVPRDASPRLLLCAAALAAAAGAGGCGTSDDPQPSVPAPATQSSPDTLLKNGDFSAGTSGWAPNVTLGRVTRFRRVRRAGHSALEISGTHDGGSEGGVLEAISDPLRASHGRSYRMTSTVTARGDVGTRGARQRIIWSTRDGKGLPPVLGREHRLRSGQTVRLIDSFRVPRRATSARVLSGIVVAGVGNAGFELGPVKVRAGR